MKKIKDILFQVFCFHKVNIIEKFPIKQENTSAYIRKCIRCRKIISYEVYLEEAGYKVISSVRPAKRRDINNI